MTIATRDGRHLRRIEYVEKGKDSAPVDAAVVSPEGQSMLYVPLNVLTAVDKRHLTTSLNYNDAVALTR